jgi:hypothetical protein
MGCAALHCGDIGLDRAYLSTELQLAAEACCVSSCCYNPSLSVQLQDPWPKPTYLFAAVAGRLRSTAQQYIAPGTRRTTALRAYAPQGYEQQVCQ